MMNTFLLVLSLASTANAFSTTYSTLAPSHTDNPGLTSSFTPQRKKKVAVDLPQPTYEDLQVEAWLDAQGVQRKVLKLLTTPLSVAGRGVFYDNTNMPAKKGDILAYIPSDSILTSSDIIPETEVLEWPFVLTAHALTAIADDTMWGQMVQLWQGVPSYTSRPADEYEEDELNQLAEWARTTPDKIQEALQHRFDDYQVQRERFLELEGLQHVDNDEIVNGIVADIHAGVLSRATELANTQGVGFGVVPLHDMVNHHNDFEKNNVGLYSVGTIREMMFCPLETHLAQTFGWSQVPASLKDEDLCLCALGEINPGEELFQSYTGWQQEPNEERRIFKLLQYGFPLA